MFVHRKAAMAGVLLSSGMLWAQAEPIQVTAIRFWTFADLTRVAITVSRPCEFMAGLAHSPERLFVDIAHSHYSIDRPIPGVAGDLRLRQVRLTETSPGVTRVVFDLTDAVSYRTTTLDSPDRIVVELQLKPRTTAFSSRALARFGHPAPFKPAPVLVFDPEPPADPDDLFPMNGPASRRVVIDPGHGGSDAGVVGPHGLLEKEVTLDVALKLSDLIRKGLGADVVLTRSSDTVVTLADRIHIANAGKADLLISIHVNSAPAASVSGSQAYYPDFTSLTEVLALAVRENAGASRVPAERREPVKSIAPNSREEESRTFARNVATALRNPAAASDYPAQDGNAKPAHFIVLAGAQMPSTLVELGFVSNIRDEANLSMKGYRQKLAEDLYRAIARYYEARNPF